MDTKNNKQAEDGNNTSQNHKTTKDSVFPEKEKATIDKSAASNPALDHLENEKNAPDKPPTPRDRKLKKEKLPKEGLLKIGQFDASMVLLVLLAFVCVGLISALFVFTKATQESLDATIKMQQREKEVSTPANPTEEITETPTETAVVIQKFSARQGEEEKAKTLLDKAKTFRPKNIPREIDVDKPFKKETTYQEFDNIYIDATDVFIELKVSNRFAITYSIMDAENIPYVKRNGADMNIQSANFGRDKNPADLLADMDRIIIEYPPSKKFEQVFINAYNSRIHITDLSTTYMDLQSEKSLCTLNNVNSGALLIKSSLDDISMHRSYLHSLSIHADRSLVTFEKISATSMDISLLQGGLALQDLDAVKRLNISSRYGLIEGYGLALPSLRLDTIATDIELSGNLQFVKINQLFGKVILDLQKENTLYDVDIDLEVGELFFHGTDMSETPKIKAVTREGSIFGAVDQGSLQLNFSAES